MSDRSWRDPKGEKAMEFLQSTVDRFRIGDRVRNRGQRWLVANMETHEHCAIVTLQGADVGNHGTTSQIVSPADRIERIVTHPRLRIVSRQRWRHQCRTLIAMAGPSHMLRTALTARMELMPFQLEPALAMVSGAASRILIADAVGLGKTVQAGLIAAELRARHAAARTLILTPASLREQWAHELDERFSMPAAIIDAAERRARQRRWPVDVNPWSTEALAIASTDFVKRPEVIRQVAAVDWDLIIVDEAHGCVAPSDRHAAVSALCRAAPHVVLLTATPHSGDADAFASLCGIGSRGDELLIFRRTRADAGLTSERRIHQLHVAPSREERALRRTMTAFAAAVERDNRDGDDRVALLMTTLKKRALSSASSLARSVQRRLESMDGTARPGDVQLALPFDAVGDMDDADQLPEWTVATLRDAAAERTWLHRLLQASQNAARTESKLRALARLLRRVREPVIVFTEYRDTLLHIRRAVAPTALVLHGGMTRRERHDTLRHFAANGVLLATDAAGEGLNLHHCCRVVVNLELPWNPMRLEQRIGRVDRIGQSRRVHVFHLIAAGSDEVRLRERLISRIEIANEAVGVASPLNRTSGLGSPQPVSTQALDEAQRIAFGRRIIARHPNGHWLAVATTLEQALSIAKTNNLPPQFASIAVLGRLATSVGGAPIALDVKGLASIAAVPPHVFSSRFVAPTGDGDLTADHHQFTDTGQFERDLESHYAFWRARMLRLKAAADDHDARHPEWQPGLFDRRAATARAAEDARSAEARARMRLRISMAEQWLPVSTTSPAVVLLLTRRPC